MSGSAPPVAAVVLSYNGRDDVLRCLRWLVASEHAPLRVVVVDNASVDDTVAAVADRFPAATVLRNRENLGFAGGCNVGIQHALSAGDAFVLLVNPDTEAGPELVGRLVSFMQAHPRAGIVGPKTHSTHAMPDGGPRLLYKGAWRRALPLRQSIPGIEGADAGDDDAPRRTDYVWGHAMMLRAEALRRIGLLDPDFFMYYEDLDLCRRMDAAGFEVWCEPGAVIRHDAPDGARGLRSERWRWECKVHSTRIFHRKHHGRLASLLLTPLTILGEAQELARTRRGAAARELLAAYGRSFGSGNRRPTGPSAPPQPTPGTGA
ncbi:MAG: glycosyltransferase family 2 protein [Acidobacteria bacterium]|jgi:GT2 family glycosyltransferase|nr:glycosyltransferase family 2 protein [Acidobacteriota bacterium]MCU0254678.1 glycosyltransferase family 2 protein [Acidobacteriota bacterium]